MKWKYVSKNSLVTTTTILTTSLISLSLFGQFRGGPPRPREAIELPPGQVTIKVEGDVRHIEGNGIPKHEPGQFPTRGNPNAIRPLNYHFTVPAEPKVADEITAVERQPFGVALNGVPFDPGTAEYWRRDVNSGWRFDALSGKINLGIDSSNGHVQPTGAYHYHGIPNGLIELSDDSKGMVLVGYASDGFPVYSEFGYNDPSDPQSGLHKVRPSYQLKEGLRPDGPKGEYDGTFVQDWEYAEGLGDLDECNGRFGVTPEYPEGIYHYYLTDTYPFIPRFTRGTPDPSFDRRSQHGRVRGSRR